MQAASSNCMSENTQLMDAKPRLLKRRFLMLAIYCVCVLEFSTFQFTYASVQDLALTYYGVGTFNLNMMVNIVYILFVPFSIFSMWLMGRFSLYISVAVGVITCAAGSWMRYAGSFPGETRFWIAFGGQCLVGVAQPFMGMNTVTLIANNWFGEHERTTATTVAGLFNVIGAGIIYGVGPAVVTVGTDFPPLLLGEAIASSALAVVTLAVFRGRPPVPPSAGAASVAQLEDQHQSFFAHTKAVFTSVPFVLLFWVFGMGFGLFIGLSGLINQLVIPMGYTTVPPKSISI